jgi:hypothetical protein
MKIAFYVEDKLEQLVLTPESETEATILNRIHDGTRQLRLRQGSFYNCQGGWVRQGYDDQSTIIVLAVDVASIFPETENVEDLLFGAVKVDLVNKIDQTVKNLRQLLQQIHNGMSEDNPLKNKILRTISESRLGSQWKNILLDDSLATDDNELEEVLDLPEPKEASSTMSVSEATVKARSLLAMQYDLGGYPNEAEMIRQEIELAGSEFALKAIMTALGVVS